MKRMTVAPKWTASKIMSSTAATTLTMMSTTISLKISITRTGSIPIIVPTGHIGEELTSRILYNNLPAATNRRIKIQDNIKVISMLHHQSIFKSHKTCSSSSLKVMRKSPKMKYSPLNLIRKAATKAAVIA